MKKSGSVTAVYLKERIKIEKQSMSRFAQNLRSLKVSGKKNTATSEDEGVSKETAAKVIASFPTSREDKSDLFRSID